jgi:hypothetical protein
MNLLKNSYYFFIVVALLIFTCCNKNFMVRYQKIELTKTDIALNQTRDSLSLDFDMYFPPKSVGKKVIIIFQPLLILSRDTIKYQTITLTGEKLFDGTSIGYKIGARIGFYNIIMLPINESASGIIRIYIYGIYKGGDKQFTMFDKEISELK